MSSALTLNLTLSPPAPPRPPLLSATKRSISRPRPVSCLATCHAPPISHPPPPFADPLESLGRGRIGGPSLYEVLRVKETASPTEIKAAYRSLVKTYHPDAAATSAYSDGRDFIAIHNAYATLSDPAARAVYDLSLGARRRNLDRVGFYPTRRWETDQCW